MTFVSNFQRYSISWKKSAEKDLESISVDKAQVITKKVNKIITGDPSLDILKLKGFFDIPTYRLRVGDYRIIFEVHEHAIVILVVAVKHRKDAY